MEDPIERAHQSRCLSFGCVDFKRSTLSPGPLVGFYGPTFLFARHKTARTSGQSLAVGWVHKKTA